MENTTNIVIFGATGNLAHKKLLPALAEVYKQEKNIKIIGYGRRELTDEEFRSSFIAELNNDDYRELLESIVYNKGDLTQTEGYLSLKEKITSDDTVFYLAVSPVYFEPIIQHLKEAGLNSAGSRIIVEKPFGEDAASAAALYTMIHQVFADDQIYIIDHYIGKETVQNILSFRFANGLFERVWNSEFIDSIQIRITEDIGIEERGEYYDNHGATKDMLQSHLLQILAAVCMEPPQSMDASLMQIKRAEFLHALQPVSIHDIAFGQYEGYQQEAKVAPDSKTDTYIALKTSIANERWAGVPVYLKTGKMLDSRVTEVFIQFKNPHFSPIEPGQSNFLAFRIQPNPGITQNVLLKVPGELMHLKNVSMDFCYQDEFTVTGNSYIRLITDAIHRNKFLFTAIDEIEASWNFVDPIMKMRIEHPELTQIYKQGTEGPLNGKERIEADGRKWLSIYPYKCDIQVRL